MPIYLTQVKSFCQFIFISFNYLEIIAFIHPKCCFKDKNEATKTKESIKIDRSLISLKKLPFSFISKLNEYNKCRKSC